MNGGSAIFVLGFPSLSSADTGDFGMAFVSLDLVELKGNVSPLAPGNSVALRVPRKACFVEWDTL